MQSGIPALDGFPQTPFDGIVCPFPQSGVEKKSTQQMNTLWMDVAAIPVGTWEDSRIDGLELDF